MMIEEDNLEVEGTLMHSLDWLCVLLRVSFENERVPKCWRHLRMTMHPETELHSSAINHQKRRLQMRCQAIDWNDTVDQTSIQKNCKLGNLFFQ